MNSTESNTKVGPEPEANPNRSRVTQGEAHPRPEKPGSPPTGAKPVTIEETNPPFTLNILDVTFSFFALLAWISLVAAGVAISSKHYVDNLGAPTKHGFWVVLGSGLVVVTCHVVPNIALLSCLAAYLGVLASRTFPGETSRAAVQEGHKAAFTMAITRGFYVYLIILSGSILFSSQGFGQWATHQPASAAESADYETYTRLAGLTSLISFTAGYNPELFKFLLARVSQFQTRQPDLAPPAGGGVPGKASEPGPEKMDTRPTVPCRRAEEPVPR